MRLSPGLLTVCFLAGCLPPLGDSPSPDSVIYLAVGAPVTVSLNQGGLCGMKVDEGCISETAKTVVDLSVERDGIISVENPTIDSNDLFVELEGKKVGETRLAVTYENVFGDEYTDVVTIRVAEIDRVELEALCLVHGEPGDILPVATDSLLPFRHATFDVNGNELATGRLEVVSEFDGFVPEAPPDRDGDVRRATAPSALGPRKWAAVGPASQPLDFRIYETGLFDLQLSASGSDILQIERVVDGQPLCTHEGQARGTLEVASGPCRPMVGGVEILGPMTMDLTDDDARIGVSGSGSCEFSISRDGATPITETLAFDNPSPVPAPGTGTPLGPDPVESGGILEQHGECVTTKNLTNGKCEILDAAGFILPDADCLFGANWQANHYDGTHNEKLIGVNVGVGLATELRTKISYELIGFIPVGSYPPNDLVVEVNPNNGLSILSNGCNDFDAEVLALSPAAPVDFAMTLSANNAFDEKNFTLRARTVERLVVDFLGVQPEDLVPVGNGDQVAYFVGSAVDFDLRYQDGSGGILYGTGPVLASAADGSAGATITDFRVSAGVAGNTISLSSPAAPQTHTIAVVSASDVTAVTGLTAQQLTPGSQHCIALQASGAGGASIHGPAPVRPTLELVGDDVLVFDVDTGAFPAQELCLEGGSAGSVELRATFGAATDNQTWTVLP